MRFEPVTQRSIAGLFSFALRAGSVAGGLRTYPGRAGSPLLIVGAHGVTRPTGIGSKHGGKKNLVAIRERACSNSGVSEGLGGNPEDGRPCLRKTMARQTARVWARGIGDFAQFRRGALSRAPGVNWAGSLTIECDGERLESNAGQNRVTKPKMSAGFSLISTYFRLFPHVSTYPGKLAGAAIRAGDSGGLGLRRPGKLRSIKVN